MSVAEAKARMRVESQARRRAMAAAAPDAGERVADFVERVVPLPPDTVASAYWPLEHELDPRPLMRRLVARGLRMALPVTIEKGRPLEFRRWTPEMELRPGPLGVMQPPPAAEALRPTLLLVPMLAFDAEGWRLGWGAGYYDRTLAALRGSAAEGAVHAVGLAFAGQEVARVPHDALDEPLDRIVTERGCREPRRR